MSGHSKWANIKRKKEANDKVKGNIFGKMSRLITLAVIENGGVADPENNVRLRLAIEKARNHNMPNENIKRAIDKASGPDRSQIKEEIFEAMAPYGVYFIILVTTDNSNRALTDIRHIMEQHGGKMIGSGSISYLFKRCALIVFNKTEVNQEKVLEFADHLKAFDIVEEEDSFYVYFPFENLGHIKDLLKDVKYEKAEIDFKPQTILALEDDEKIKKISELVDYLEALDDVQKVFTNL